LNKSESDSRHACAVGSLKKHLPQSTGSVPSWREPAAGRKPIGHLDRLPTLQVGHDSGLDHPAYDEPGDWR
jgi:hypothetical protein